MSADKTATEVSDDRSPSLSRRALFAELTEFRARAWNELVRDPDNPASLALYGGRIEGADFALGLIRDDLSTEVDDMDAARSAYLLRSWSEAAGLRDPDMWDEVRAGGRRRPGPVVALVCPLCAAWVPLGERDPGVTYRDLHADWHEMGHRKRAHS